MGGDWKPRVFLVGAGPGDPGLLTRRGEAVLRRADVILYDWLTNDVLLELAPSGVEKVFVGKPYGAKCKPRQEDIERRMIEEARKGRTVVRLKGGDSFVFGRGGEEAEALLKAGIPFEVVPGVTSVSAVPALAGIPISHRRFNSVVHVLTGHENPDDPAAAVPWDLLAASRQTIVVLMFSRHMDKILDRLARGGMAPETPIAVIARGSYADQFSARTTLGEARRDPDRLRPTRPSLMVIGEAAGMDEALNWFERRPLFGRRVALTRPEESGSEMLEALREAGAAAANLPAIRFEPAPGHRDDEFKARLETLAGECGWLILSSPAAIRFAFSVLERLGLDARALHGVRVAAVGARSASDLAGRGVRADFVPEKASGEQLARELPLGGARSALIAGSSRSRPELAEGLRARGLEVHHHSLYEPVADAAGLADLKERLASDALDAVVVASPSAARVIYNEVGPDRSAMRGGVRWFALGETTARAMRELGFPDVEAAEAPTPEAVVDMLIRAWQTESASAGADGER